MARHERVRGVVLGVGCSCLCRVASVTVCADTRRVRYAGKSLRLTRAQYDLCAYLARYPDFVRSRSDILDNVTDPNHTRELFEGSVDALIKRLRRDMRTAFGCHFIETVRGMGYSWSLMPL